MNFDYYFATQYKECFVYFGIPHGTSVADSKAKTDDQVCTMSGCVATIGELDRENGYIWSTMPQLSIQLQKKGSIKVRGGYTCGERINILGIVDIPQAKDSKIGHGANKRMGYRHKYTTKCWNTSLATPSSHWLEGTPNLPSKKILFP